ncbi:MAG TPA: transporter associated domain-containing protein [Candidatus Nitrosotenuis sp.]|jgi:CBS domain containing-hemolysin-like protein|nr:transporter associated domain-containing protein [Candidatus Nitrosotenuis sp.]
MSQYLLLAGGVAILFLLAFLAAAEAALGQIPAHRTLELVEKRDVSPAEALQERARVLTTLLVSRTVLLLLLGFLSTLWAALVSRALVTPEAAALTGGLSPSLVLGITLALVLVVALAVDIIPRRLAMGHGEGVVRRIGPLVRLLTRLVYPMIAFLLLLLTGRRAEQILTGPQLTEEDIRVVLEQGQAQGVLEEEETEMIHSVIEFRDTIAREVMVPRVDVVAVPVETSLVKAMDLMIEKGLSRLPVYEGDIDHIVGLVYNKDLLVHFREGRLDVPLADILRPAKFVPGSKRIGEILRELQRDKMAMAIVVDEYGGTEGVLTLEDILEEIVGEITDEYDREIAPLQRIDENTAIVDAKMILEDVNEELGLELPVEEYETLGGYLYGMLGHVPTLGEAVEVDGVRLQVEAVERRRITRVRVERLRGESSQKMAG